MSTCCTLAAKKAIHSLPYSFWSSLHQEIQYLKVNYVLIHSLQYHPIQDFDLIQVAGTKVTLRIFKCRFLLTYWIINTWVNLIMIHFIVVPTRNLTNTINLWIFHHPPLFYGCTTMCNDFWMSVLRHCESYFFMELFFFRCHRKYVSSEKSDHWFSQHIVRIKLMSWWKIWYHKEMVSQN